MISTTAGLPLSPAVFLAGMEVSLPPKNLGNILPDQSI